MSKRTGSSSAIPQTRLVDSSQPDAVDPSDRTRSDRQVSPQISKYLAQIGKKGGLKGGKARMKLLTPEEHKELSRKGGKARLEKLTKEQRREIAMKGVIARRNKRK